MVHLTELISAIEEGNESARVELIEAVYHELHLMARSKMKGEPKGVTLQATMLVHDAFERLMGRPTSKPLNRKQFFTAASTEMRRILIEAARRRNRQKRGAGADHVPLEEQSMVSINTSDEILLVHEAVDLLETEDKISAGVVKARYFVGLTNDEAAEVLNITSKEAEHHWEYARTFLWGYIEKARRLTN